MPDKPTAARDAYGHLAPKFAEVTDEVLFGDIWKQPDLSPRDRSVVTVSSLISLYRINELPAHLRLAQQNGVSRDELVELITHLAFYAGWPKAMSAMAVAKQVFGPE